MNNDSFQEKNVCEYLKLQEINSNLETFYIHYIPLLFLVLSKTKFI